MTLSGPGGVGKTRLAIRVATDVAKCYMDGVFFITLAPLRDPELVAPTIARALGMPNIPGQTPADALIAYLRERRLLLLLDNMEHLLPSAPLVAELLAGCPRLTVLVTSRATLRLRGEHAYLVPPLAVPSSPDNLAYPPALDDLERVPAVALFLQKARELTPEFWLTADNAGVVAEICRRLDGLPLALELAAARLRILLPRDLLTHLEPRLPLLTGGACDLPERQQTLRATLEWSHELLNAGEQVVFRRLAVFASGYTPGAAGAICMPGDGREVDLLDSLGGLMEKSLLQRDDRLVPGVAGGELRIGMLETVREYATERLEESGEAEATRRRHTEYYLALAERAEAALRGQDQVAWLAVLRGEGDNLRAALWWTTAHGEIELGLRLAAALWRFWTTHGSVSDGRRWLEGLLALDAPGQQFQDMMGECRHREGRDGATGHAAMRAKALLVAGSLAGYQGDIGQATALLEESAALARAEDCGCLSLVISALADLARSQGDLEQAETLADESMALARALEDAWTLGVALDVRGVVAYYRGDHGRAEVLWRESLDLRRRLGDKRAIGTLLASLGELAHAHGDLTQAAAFLQESVTLARELGDKMDLAWSLHNLGDIALKQGDDGQAAALYEEGLTLHLNITGRQGNRGVAFCLDGLAGVAYVREWHDRAASLLAAADGLRTALGISLEPIERATHDRMAVAVRDALGDSAFTAAARTGRPMPLEDAISLALSAARSPYRGARRSKDDANYQHPGAHRGGAMRR